MESGWTEEADVFRLLLPIELLLPPMPLCSMELTDVAFMWKEPSASDFRPSESLTSVKAVTADDRSTSMQ